MQQLSVPRVALSLPDLVSARLEKYAHAYGMPVSVLVAGLVECHATEGNVFRQAQRLAAARLARRMQLQARRKAGYRERQKAKLSLVG